MTQTPDLKASRGLALVVALSVLGSIGGLMSLLGALRVVTFGDDTTPFSLPIAGLDLAYIASLLSFAFAAISHRPWALQAILAAMLTSGLAGLLIWVGHGLKSDVPWTTHFVLWILAATIFTYLTRSEFVAVIREQIARYRE